MGASIGEAAAGGNRFSALGLLAYGGAWVESAPFAQALWFVLMCVF
jgi:hypothetical protein